MKSNETKYEKECAVKNEHTKNMILRLLSICDPEKPFKELSDAVGASRPSLKNWIQRPEQILLKHHLRIEHLYRENKTEIFLKAASETKGVK